MWKIFTQNILHHNSEQICWLILPVGFNHGVCSILIMFNLADMRWHEPPPQEDAHGGGGTLICWGVSWPAWPSSSSSQQLTLSIWRTSWKVRWDHLIFALICPMRPYKDYGKSLPTRHCGLTCNLMTQLLKETIFGLLDHWVGGKCFHCTGCLGLWQSVGQALGLCS